MYLQSFGSVSGERNHIFKQEAHIKHVKYSQLLIQERNLFWNILAKMQHLEKDWTNQEPANNHSPNIRGP